MELTATNTRRHWGQVRCLAFVPFSLVALAFAQPESAPEVVEHVVHISVDGLSSDRLSHSLEYSPPERFPAIRRLIAEGASTFDARTDYDFTITLPNHTCMLTGRPVLRPEGEPDIPDHGWTGNDSPTRRQTLHNRNGDDGEYIPSVFDVVHDHGRSTALFASKRKFILYEQSYHERAGAPDRTGEDNGRDKIDVFVYDRTDQSPQTAAPLCDALIDGLREHHFNYTFVHLRDPDSAGHKHGWRSEEWSESVEQVDGYLQRLFALIEDDDVLRGNTAIILTTDHGGFADNHGNEAEPLNYTIPFFVWGPGVAAGADLYELNAHSRTPPASEGRAARPSYSSEQQPIRNGDSGNLALHLLGLPAIPGSTINEKQDLRVR